MNICEFLPFHMKITYLSVHLWPFKFTHADVQLAKMHTQKCGNLEKTMVTISSHIQDLAEDFRTCLNNVNITKWHFECEPHWSADLTQRSRLFICVETNSWYMLSSSIASAVFWVNSAQLLSGKSMSMNNITVPSNQKRLSLSPSNRTYALGGYWTSRTLGR